jgi:hypothetical protein
MLHQREFAAPIVRPQPAGSVILRSGVRTMPVPAQTGQVTRVKVRLASLSGLPDRHSAVHRRAGSRPRPRAAGQAAIAIVSAKPAEHFRSTPGGYFHHMVGKGEDRGAQPGPDDLGPAASERSA